MRILVLSDSHGNAAAMEEAVRRTQPDQIVHLGDYWRDCQGLLRLFPEIPLCRVPGNCDAFDLRARGQGELLVHFDGHAVFLCHGDRYRVKESLLPLSYAAREKGAELALFGHTHVPHLETAQGLTLLNPGSVGGILRRDCAVVETDGGKLACALLSL